MAGKTDIWDSIWDRSWFVKSAADVKALWFYLTTRNRAVSGIYVRSIEDISLGCNIEQERVREILKILDQHNIHYDFDNEIVYVKKRFEFRTYGGSPEPVGLSIKGDWRVTKRAPAFWIDFLEYYRELAQEESKIAKVMKHVDINAKAGNAVVRKTNPIEENESEVAILEAALLHKFQAAKDVDEDDWLVVLNALNTLGTTKGGRPRKAKIRAGLFELGAQHPPWKFANACKAFLDSKAKGMSDIDEGYLKGILNKSAESKYANHQVAEGADPDELFGNQGRRQ